MRAQPNCGKNQAAEVQQKLFKTLFSDRMKCISPKFGNIKLLDMKCLISFTNAIKCNLPLRLNKIGPKLLLVHVQVAKLN
jgi:hypothetical protein